MPTRKIAYIYYFDGIDEPKVNNLMSVCTNIMAQLSPDELYFLISSKGGDVKAGITLYNFLKSLPPKITMHNIGAIDSIATVVFAAGDKRYAAPNTTFHFHGVQVNISGPAQLGISQLNEIRSSVIKNHDQIAEIVCADTELEPDAIKELFRQGEAKGTDFALDKKIISRVFLPSIPAHGLVTTINNGNS